eukprot:365603-Chlamydomonas_euryale.AAC.7
MRAREREVAADRRGVAHVCAGNAPHVRSKLGQRSCSRFRCDAVVWRRGGAVGRRQGAAAAGRRGGRLEHAGESIERRGGTQHEDVTVHATDRQFCDLLHAVQGGAAWP